MTLFWPLPVEKPKWTGSTALAIREPGCPECSGPLFHITTDQPALFIHGGYGATQRTTWEACSACRWSRVAVIGEIRPDRSPLSRKDID